MNKFLVLAFGFLLCHLGYGQQLSNKLSFVAEINDCFNPKYMDDLGIEVGSKIGNIVTLRMNADQSKMLCKNIGITYLSPARKIKPELSRLVHDIKADSAYSGINLAQPYTGKDVIIGITDWGFDYTHPMFYDTALKHTRILAAWDQYKTSGPHPMGYSYGTEYEGEKELFAAEKDTFNVYQYATHGSHVAGIAGGSGAGTEHRGVAFEANFLFVTFLIDEAAILDAFAWMKAKADFYQKPLVINMSWGLYHLGTLDGSSPLSKAIDEYSKQGVVFVTSAGNNGDETLHIKKDFSKDTFQTLVEFYPYSAHPEMWGQSISMWGTPGHPFHFTLSVFDKNKNQMIESQNYSAIGTASSYTESFMSIGTDTVFFNVRTYGSHPLNQRPHARLRVKNTNPNFYIVLKSWATDGTVHYWNVVELNNEVGNWGMPFTAWKPGWVAGDNLYTIGEPACTKSAISVAAHSPEYRAPNGNIVGGQIATFSSIGPTLDGRIKPDISAPGVGIASSVSSFTSRPFTLLENVQFNGKDYPFSRFSGTSMSSPAIAGVVALMLQAKPDLSAEEIKTILKKTARTDSKTGVIKDTASTQWGWGKVNAYLALKEVEKLNPTVPDHLKRVYPNPSSGKIFYSGEGSKIYQATLFTRTGKKLNSSSIGKNLGFNVSAYPIGLYFLLVEDSGGKVYKVLIEK